jgi:Glutamate-1-semialdehyde aminotransferase
LPEEVTLAEKLLGLNPWAGMVRFARTGGEANAIALRLARGATGKDRVAICGYHGWHDWYLSTNLSDSGALDDLLLPGLSPIGVPKNLKGQTVPFQFGDSDALERLVGQGGVGTIIMEVSRTFRPDVRFLRKVRQIADSHDGVRVFDECTSGFRVGPSGLHMELGVEPDVATYGKALGNGYAITAVVGREEVMQVAQSSFVSSTFWSERIGPTAALATLDEMARLESWEKLVAAGRQVKNGWTQIGEQSGVDIRYRASTPLPLSLF